MDKATDALVSAFDAAVLSSECNAVYLADDGALVVTFFNSTSLGAQAVKGMGFVNAVTGVAEAWQQDVAIGGATPNVVSRSGVAGAHVVAAADNTFSTCQIRVFSRATGATIAVFDGAGAVALSALFWNHKFWTPREGKAVIHGAMTSLSATSGGTVVSGTSRMFVIDVP
jgi:hypothetical protein